MPKIEWKRMDSAPLDMTLALICEVYHYINRQYGYSGTGFFVLREGHYELGKHGLPGKWKPTTPPDCSTTENLHPILWAPLEDIVPEEITDFR